MTRIVRGHINARGEWVDQQDIFKAPDALYTPSVIHYGSRFLFDGKGHLFFTMGERGDMTNAQRLDTPLGKIHRVNDDGSIPADNPFVHTAGAIPSIWSYGHRNPEGLSYDPATGILWESEHGPTGGDEINIIEKGHNYGWGVVSMGLQPGITPPAPDGDGRSHHLLFALHRAQRHHLQHRQPISRLEKQSVPGGAWSGRNCSAMRLPAARSSIRKYCGTNMAAPVP